MCIQEGIGGFFNASNDMAGNGIAHQNRCCFASHATDVPSSDNMMKQHGEATHFTPAVIQALIAGGSFTILQLHASTFTIRPLLSLCVGALERRNTMAYTVSAINRDV